MTSGVDATPASFDDDAFAQLPDDEAQGEYPYDGGGLGGYQSTYTSSTSQAGKFSQQYSNSRGERGGSGNQGGFRQPPHDKEAEQGVLGAMLLSAHAILDVIEILRPEDFYHPAHTLIYQAIIDLFAESKEIDPVIVSGRLDRQNELDRVGGAPYIHTLIATVPTAANARYYAEIVEEKALLRRLVDAGTRVVQLGYEGAEGAEVDAVVDMAQQEVFGINRNNSAEDYSAIRDLIDPAFEELKLINDQGGQAKGVPTGFTDLDDLTNGLHGGQMIIVAARPGVGKSTIALDFVRHAAIRNNQASVIFSLEMSKSEITMRMLSAEANVKLADMRAGRLDETDWQRLVSVYPDLEKAPIFIDDSASMTMMDIRAKARRLKQKHDLKFIVLDYLQLMSSGKKVESRQQEVAEFSRQLKLLAKELDVPLIAISQLNRGPESRTDKKPQLSDLRESGSLEQDADIVMLLFRPDSQNNEDERAGEADIIIAKHRGGPIGTITVVHQLQYSRFNNMARD
ncbi:replicative DNA helicase [Corynebacterium caspium]|uniref:replicative DNA helicase n=1 Tax=Corynebacterium caspium TaxID=234828 RepID=UPI000378D0CD|nr:replicative DNA helicase [Corynebacterium caspium]WKD60022.1 Replicative DNA helicase [Corynebacterium caspium DSM 44850]